MKIVKNLNNINNNIIMKIVKKYNVKYVNHKQLNMV